MVDNTQDRVKFPLGNDLYATVNVWREKPQLHFRYFREVASVNDSSKTFVIPTKNGVVLNPSQAHQLSLAFPRLISELQRVMEALSTPKQYQPFPLHPSQRVNYQTSTNFHGAGPEATPTTSHDDHQSHHHHHHKHV